MLELQCCLCRPAAVQNQQLLQPLLLRMLRSLQLQLTRLGVQVLLQGAMMAAAQRSKCWCGSMQAAAAGEA
jgi:DNA polymerase III psi subunit